MEYRCSSHFQPPIHKHTHKDFQICGSGSEGGLISHMPVSACYQGERHLLPGMYFGLLSRLIIYGALFNLLLFRVNSRYAIARRRMYKEISCSRAGLHVFALRFSDLPIPAALGYDNYL